MSAKATIEVFEELVFTSIYLHLFTMFVTVAPWNGKKLQDSSPVQHCALPLSLKSSPCTYHNIKRVPLDP